MTTPERMVTWRFDQVGDPAEIEDAVRTTATGTGDKMIQTLKDMAIALIPSDSEGVRVVLQRSVNEAGRFYTQILVEEIPLLVPGSRASRRTILQEEGGQRQ